MLRVTIENLRAIKKADIVIGGITVLTGENGSGKSTISRLVYDFIKMCINYDHLADKSLRSDLEEIARSLLMIFDKIEYDTKFSDLSEEQIKVESFLGYPWQERKNYTIDEISKGLEKTIDFLANFQSKKTIKTEEYLSRIPRRLNLKIKYVNENPVLLPDIKNIIKELHEENTKIKKDKPFSFIKQSIKHNDLILLEDNYQFYEDDRPLIKKNEEQEKKISLLDSVRDIIYIDSPMALGYSSNRPRFEGSSYWDDLNHMLSKKNKSPINRDNKKIDDFFKEVLKGDVEINNDLGEEYLYKREDGKTFNLLECATGLKSFSMIRYLFKNNYLHQDTLLILDEPEAHLHPQWIVEYARMVVMLNQELGMKFLISSHNSNMVSAIKDITKKEKIDKVNFYLSEKKEKGFSYEYRDLKKSIEATFESFNKAFDKIDKYGKW